MFLTTLRSLGWLTASLLILATAVAANTYCNSAAAGAPTAPAATAATVAVEENPTVRPGLVKWHPSVADARAAALKSGKPVLVFHMMGQLDKQFC
jgi:hypothetical protein